jgi:hypothetical protein
MVRFGLIVAILAILAAACGGGSSDPSTISGRGYEFRLPSGLTVEKGEQFAALKEQQRARRPELVLDTHASSPDAIIAVSLLKGGAADVPALDVSVANVLADEVRASPEDIVGEDGTLDDVSADPRKLDGESMILLEVTGTRGGAPYLHYQLFTLHDGQSYTIRVEGDPSATKAARAALVDSWKWR